MGLLIAVPLALILASVWLVATWPGRRQRARLRAAGHTLCPACSVPVDDLPEEAQFCGCGRRVRERPGAPLLADPA